MNGYALGAGLAAASPDIGVVAQNEANTAMEQVRQNFKAQTDAAQQAFKEHLQQGHQTFEASQNADKIAAQNDRFAKQQKQQSDQFQQSLGIKKAGLAETTSYHSTMAGLEKQRLVLEANRNPTSADAGQLKLIGTLTHSLTGAYSAQAKWASTDGLNASPAQTAQHWQQVQEQYQIPALQRQLQALQTRSSIPQKASSPPGAPQQGAQADPAPRPTLIPQGQQPQSVAGNAAPSGQPSQVVHAPPGSQPPPNATKVYGPGGQQGYLVNGQVVIYG